MKIILSEAEFEMMKKVARLEMEVKDTVTASIKRDLSSLQHTADRANNACVGMKRQIEQLEADVKLWKETDITNKEKLEVANGVAQRNYDNGEKWMKESAAKDYAISKVKTDLKALAARTKNKVSEVLDVTTKHDNCALHGQEANTLRELILECERILGQ